MQLILAIDNLMSQMQNMLLGISDETYVSPVETMSGSTIGEHTRHVIEFYVELQNGYESGIVNYDNRKRDRRIETDRCFALEMLAAVSGNLDKNQKNMSLVSHFGLDRNDTFVSETNYTRELIYNLEHTVHHMALIRVAITSLTDLSLPPAFGVAAATLQFRESCAQ